jgi:hypothetical protein
MAPYRVSFLLSHTPFPRLVPGSAKAFILVTSLLNAPSELTTLYTSRLHVVHLWCSLSEVTPVMYLLKTRLWSAGRNCSLKFQGLTKTSRSALRNIRSFQFFFLLQTIRAASLWITSSGDVSAYWANISTVDWLAAQMVPGFNMSTAGRY